MNGRPVSRSLTRLLLIPVLSIAAIALGGCGYRGLNSVVLPGGAGTGEASYVVTAEFATAGNLVPNSEVKVDDVTVGTVRAITRGGWHARIILGLNPSVDLPANVTASIGQKSLLGAAYVELRRPTTEPATGRLHGGDVIPLSRTSKYPDTEELLAALSLWLNGGGLQHVQTISVELNKALGGNEPQVRELLGNLTTTVSSLDQQRTQLVAVIDALDRLGSRLAARDDDLGRGIEKLGPGIAVLNQQRTALTDALKALDDFSVVGLRVIHSSGDGLQANLHDLRPVLAQLRRSGNDLPNSLEIAGSLLFPISQADRIIKGDAFSASLTLDLTRIAGQLPGPIPPPPAAPDRGH